MIIKESFNSKGNFHSVYSSRYTSDNCSIVFLDTMGWKNPIVSFNFRFILLNRNRCSSFSWEFSWLSARSFHLRPYLTLHLNLTPKGHWRSGCKRRTWRLRRRRAPELRLASGRAWHVAVEGRVPARLTAWQSRKSCGWLPGDGYIVLPLSPWSQFRALDTPDIPADPSCSPGKWEGTEEREAGRAWFLGKANRPRKRLPNLMESWTTWLLRRLKHLRLRPQNAQLAGTGKMGVLGRWRKWQLTRAGKGDAWSSVAPFPWASSKWWPPQQWRRPRKWLRLLLRRWPTEHWPAKIPRHSGEYCWSLTRDAEPVKAAIFPEFGNFVVGRAHGKSGFWFLKRSDRRGTKSSADWAPPWSWTWFWRSETPPSSGLIINLAWMRSFPSMSIK